MAIRLQTSQVEGDPNLGCVGYLGDDVVPRWRISWRGDERGDDAARIEPSVRRSEEATVVEMPVGAFNSLDQIVLGHARRFLLELADKIEPPFLIVDLSGTESFGATFLNVLVLVWRRLKKRGGALALCGLRRGCAELVETLHLDRLFQVYPSPKEALRAVSPRTRGA